MKQYEKIECANRNEWLAERAKGIGASEISAILGVNPWQSSYELYEKKKNGGAEDDALAQNAAVQAGHYLEDAVARYYADKAGKHVIKASAGDWLAVDPAHPWRRCSPDRTYFLNGDGGEKGVLECKTCRKALDKDGIPLHYYCQVQWQLGILGLRKGVLAWLASGLDFDFVEIAFDPIFFNKMAEAADEWWRNFTNGVKPSAATAADVRSLFPDPIADAATANEEDIAVWRELKSVKAHIKELETREKELTDVFCRAFGNCETLAAKTDAGGDILATFKAQKSTRLDSASLKKEMPDIYERFSKTTTTRVLRLR